MVLRECLTHQAGLELLGAGIVAVSHYTQFIWCLHWAFLNLVAGVQGAIEVCSSGHTTLPRVLTHLQVRIKILASLVTQFDSGFKAEVLSFILEDVRARLDLAFAWLYQEYNAYLAAGPSGTLDKYEDCLICLLSGLQEKPDQKDG